MARDDRSTAPTTVVDRLFVYGTLRSGQTARNIVAPYVGAAIPATARGTLYAFPVGYPGVVDDDGGQVHGELLLLTDLAAALPLLDAFEGEDFVRVLTEVKTAGGSSWAWIYVLTSRELARHGVVVEHGDWSRYVATGSSP